MVCVCVYVCAHASVRACVREREMSTSTPVYTATLSHEGKNAAIFFFFFSASAGDTQDRKASSYKWTDGFLYNVITETAARGQRL